MFMAVDKDLVMGLVAECLPVTPFPQFIAQLEVIVGNQLLVEGGSFYDAGQVGVLVLVPRVFENFQVLYIFEWPDRELKLLGVVRRDSPPLIDSLKILSTQRLAGEVKIQVKFRLRDRSDEPKEWLILR